MRIEQDDSLALEPKELMDVDLWSLIELFLPARAPRNRRYEDAKPARTGRTEFPRCRLMNAETPAAVVAGITSYAPLPNATGAIKSREESLMCLSAHSQVELDARCCNHSQLGQRG
jgi:hypothetical protein